MNNEQYFGQEASFTSARRPIFQNEVRASSQGAKNQPSSLDNADVVCINKVVVLNEQEKEAFLNVMERPPRVNDKLLKAFRKLQQD